MRFVFDKKDTWVNVHIFQYNREKSLCGREFRFENPEYLSDPLADKEARQFAVDLQNEKKEVCGQCVAKLYSDNMIALDSK